MDKTAQTEMHRLFLIEGLPEPLTPASSHLQLFDNYIENTRLRLRRIRDPYSKAWTQILQQRFPAKDGEDAITKLAEIILDEAEYAVLEKFEGREIRKNRYFHEFDRHSFTFDVYLGELWGLSTVRIDFESREALTDFVSPPFALLEVTSDGFFQGSSLVDAKFADVQDHLAKMITIAPTAV